MSKIYIHYGSNEFKPKLFKPVKNEMMFTKPKGGLWASPINAKESWKEWCERNDFHLQLLEKSFVFGLKPETKVLFIDDVKQLDDLPKVKNPAIFENFNIWVCLDFEELSKEYDAIEITLSEEKSHNGEFWGGLYDKLYGWDCDSICIMNPDCLDLHPRFGIEPQVEEIPPEPGDFFKRYKVKGYKVKVIEQESPKSEAP